MKFNVWKDIVSQSSYFKLNNAEGIVACSLWKLHDSNWMRLGKIGCLRAGSGASHPPSLLIKK